MCAIGFCSNLSSQQLKAAGAEQVFSHYAALAPLLKRESDIFLEI
jgi:hypothetical protein